MGIALENSPLRISHQEKATTRPMQEAELRGSLRLIPPHLTEFVGFTLDDVRQRCRWKVVNRLETFETTQLQGTNLSVIDWMLLEHHDSKSIGELASEIGVSYTAVRGLFEHLGLPKFSLQEAARRNMVQQKGAFAINPSTNRPFYELGLEKTVRLNQPSKDTAKKPKQQRIEKPIKPDQQPTNKNVLTTLGTQNAPLRLRRNSIDLFQQVLDLSNSGNNNIQEIAELLGISYDYVHRIRSRLVRYGYVHSSRVHQEAFITNIADLWNSGSTAKEIADSLEKSLDSVKSLLRRMKSNGVQLREGPSEKHRIKRKPKSKSPKQEYDRTKRSLIEVVREQITNIDQDQNGVLSNPELAEKYELPLHVVEKLLGNLTPEERLIRRNSLIQKELLTIEKSLSELDENIMSPERIHLVRRKAGLMNVLTRGSGFASINPERRRQIGSQGGSKTVKDKTGIFRDGRSYERRGLKIIDKPNGLEMIFIQALLEEGLFTDHSEIAEPGEIYFVGAKGNKRFFRFLDGKLKLPDFKVKGSKKVIELYGDYYHSERFCKKYDQPDYSWIPERLVEEYAKVGVDCLVFWEREIRDGETLNAIIKKVREWSLI